MSRLSSLPFAALLSVITLSVSASGLGCSSDEGEAASAAPTVRDLTLTPTEVEAGKATILDGNVTVEDVDGDIAGLSAQVTLPDGSVQALPQTNVAAGDAKTAPIQLKVQLLLPAPGTYTMQLWARDRAGNESTKLEQKLTAK